ncbi:hypothetical protein BX616_000217 [Lobosporangium transversale]|nr:hypothetical protein BX616_000217 [Lobosporangium transversale]
MQEKNTLAPAIITQDHIHAIVSQPYELNEFPIPHLFIVLPQRTHSQSATADQPLLSRQFRLFFLCECGRHTSTNPIIEKETTNGMITTIQHEIHLAKHKGYSIIKPSEFFERYGRYALAIMEMIKQGFSADGMTIRPLSQSQNQLTREISSLESGLDLAKNSFSSLVDETINFIHNQQITTNLNSKWGYSDCSNGIDVDNSDDDTAFLTIKSRNKSKSSLEKLTKTPLLEGADLRQLESYLSIEDDECTPGNLYRMTIQDGKKTRWVCIDHLRASFRPAAEHELLNMIERCNKRLYQGERSQLMVVLMNRTQAEQLYDVLKKTQIVQQLNIVLAWDVSWRDIRKLASAVTESNVVHFSMAGHLFTRTGSLLDILNRFRRFNPVVQLLFKNQTVQSLHLDGFQDFFAHVSAKSPQRYFRHSAELAPQLRSLTLRFLFNVADRTHVSIMTRILRACPSLARLTLWCDQLCPTLDFIMSQIGNNNQDNHSFVTSTAALNQLKLVTENFTMVFRLFQGAIQEGTMRAIAPFIKIVSQEQALLQRRTLVTKLILNHERDTPVMDEQSWTRFLLLSPKLSEIEICCHDNHLPIYIDMITSVRVKIISQNEGTFALHRLQFNLHMTTLVSLSFPLSLYCPKSVDTPLPRISVNSLDTSEFSGPSPPSSALSQVLREYGSVIRDLLVDDKFTYDHAMLLDEVTKDRGSKLRTLTCIRSVGKDNSSDSYEWIERVLERSTELERFTLEFYKLHEANQKGLMERLLLRVGKRVHKLVLGSTFPEEWLPKVARAAPTRYELPLLDSLSICAHGLQEPPQNIVEWIANIVSKPSTVIPGTNSGQQQQRFSRSVEPTIPYTTTARTWTALERIWIGGIHFRPQQWEVILKAIDFSSLQDLGFYETNFDLVQLQLLINLIPEPGTSPSPLHWLRLGGTIFDGNWEGGGVQIPSEMMTTLQRKASLIRLS